MKTKYRDTQKIKVMKVKLSILCFALFALLSCNSDNTVRYVIIETEYGDMKVELYNSTPGHRDNFIKLVKENFYDDLLFHRIISGFMIQGGDPDSRGAAAGQRLGMGGPGYTIPAEIGAPHFRGTLAAARTGGASNPEKRSSGSQFYIVHGTPQSGTALNGMAQSKGISYNAAQIAKYGEIGGTPMLDNDYTVFGEVVEGLDVVDKIAAVQKDGSDRPRQDVTMKIRMSN